MQDFHCVFIEKTNVSGTWISKCRTHMKTNGFRTLGFASKKHLFYHWKWSSILEKSWNAALFVSRKQTFSVRGIQSAKHNENQWFAHSPSQAIRALVQDFLILSSACLRDSFLFLFYVDFYFYCPCPFLFFETVCFFSSLGWKIK